MSSSFMFATLLLYEKSPDREHNWLQLQFCRTQCSHTGISPEGPLTGRKLYSFADIVELDPDIKWHGDIK